MNGIGADIRYRAAVVGAVVAGAFSAIVCAFLVWNYINSDIADPLDSEEFRTLKVAQKADPADEQLKDRIRRMDLELRREYFRRQALAVRGGYLLAGGLAVFLAAAGVAAGYRKSVPMPAPPGNQERAEVRSSALARWSVAVIGLAFLGGASVLAVLAPIEGFPLIDAHVEKPAPQVARFPSADEIAKNWPRFRGPGGRGISAYTNVPANWNGKTGEGILWKTPMPLPGKNSPVVWGNRIFLTGATKDKRQVYCFDADSGGLLWQRDVTNVPGSVAKPPKVSEDTGYAAPTAVADGQRVYAIFANGDLICFDFDGKRLWAMNLGLPENMYGHATSLTMWGRLLLVKFDQGRSGDEKSEIIALDALTGREVWSKSRPVPSSWSSPIVINAAGRDQLITCGNPWVISYNPADGTELWRAKCLDGDVAPCPIFAGEMVFAVNTGAVLAAIRPDGAGDVTKTHIAWTAEDGLPDISSPVSDGKLLWLMETYGTLTCYDAQTGKVIWENDLDMELNASPSLVGERVYLNSIDGVTIIIEAARKYKEITRCELGEKVYASPAFMDGRIYIRGEKHLFCISGAKQ